MTHAIRGAGALLTLACAVAVSCTDLPTAPSGGSGLEARAGLRAGSPSDAAGVTPFVTGAGLPSGPGEPVATGACMSGAASGAAQDPWEEPAPTDVCAIARYLPDTPRPGRQMASAFIDASGGSLRIGDFEIVVPAGAVDRRTRFVILLPPPGQDERVYAEFLPHGVTFAVPVTIRLPLASTDALPDAPVTWWSQSGASWIDQPSAATSDGRVEARVDHFSFYGTRARSGITIAGG